jgi:hypothetical protein
VSAEWLLDDQLDESSPATAAQLLDDRELIMETALRYRKAILEVAEALKFCEATDLTQTTVALYERGLEDPASEALDPRIVKAAEAIHKLEFIIIRLDTEQVAFTHHDELPGAGDFSQEELLINEVARRARKLIKSRADLQWIQRYIAADSWYTHSTRGRERIAEMISSSVDAIKEGRFPDPLDSPQILAADPGSTQEAFYRDMAVLQRRGEAQKLTPYSFNLGMDQAD